MDQNLMLKFQILYLWRHVISVLFNKKKPLCIYSTETFCIETDQSIFQFSYYVTSEPRTTRMFHHHCLIKTRFDLSYLVLSHSPMLLAAAAATASSYLSASHSRSSAARCSPASRIRGSAFSVSFSGRPNAHTALHRAYKRN